MQNESWSKKRVHGMGTECSVRAEEATLCRQNYQKVEYLSLWWLADATWAHEERIKLLAGTSLRKQTDAQTSRPVAERGAGGYM